MNAKEAAKMSERNKAQRPQRDWVMKEIERAAKKGYTYFAVNDPQWVLFGDDIEWLQILGYRVSATSIGKDFTSGVIIRW